MAIEKTVSSGVGDEPLDSARECLRALEEIGEAVRHGGGLEGVMALVASRAARVLGADAAAIRLTDDTGEWPERFASHNLDAAIAAQMVRIAPAAASPVVVENLRESDSADREVFAQVGFGALLGLPLVLGGEPIGSLTLLFHASRPFSAAEQGLGLAFAGSAATAIAQAQTIGKLADRVGRLTALHDVGRGLVSTRPLDGVLQQIIDSAVEVVPVERAVLFLLDEGTERLYPRATRGILPWQRLPPVPLGQGPPGQAVAERRTVYDADVRAELPAAGHEVVTASGLTLGEFTLHQGYVAALAAPLVSRDRVHGAVCLYWDTVHRYDEPEAEALAAFADYAAVAIDVSTAFAETEARLRGTETLLAVSRAVGSSLDVAESMRRVASETGRALRADAVGAYLADPGRAVLRPVAGYHIPKHLRETFLRYPFPLRGHRFVEEALELGQPVFSSDAATDARIDRESLERFYHRSLLFMPMGTRDVPIGGFFVLWWERKYRLTDEELRLAEGISRQAALAIENARLYREATDARKEMEALAGTGRELMQTLNLDQVLGLILQQTLFLTEADVAYIALTHDDGTARSVACRGQRTSAFEGILVRPGSGVAGLALTTGEIQESMEAVVDLSTEGSRQLAAEDVRSVLVVPIRLASRTVGLLWLGRRMHAHFSERTKARLGALSLWLAIALDNARLYKEIAAKHTELELANASLKESLRVQAEFLANTSHELRTPLYSMMGLLQAITDGLCHGPEEERTFVVEARGCAEHLLTLINDILDMAKIEAGAVRPQLEPVDIGTVFEEVRPLFQQPAETKGLSLVFESPVDLGARLMADQNRLRQVLVNLIGNSLKFTDEGGIVVRAVASPATGFMTIEVEDTGIGIPAERQRHLFQKFVQADGSTSRRRGGAGLGLAISRSFVEMMGGVIALESAGEGKGTRVVLSLPLPTDTAAALAAVRVTPPASIEGPNETPLILIVDDNVEFRAAVRDLLHEVGFQTIEASNADEALETATRLHPALFLVDLALASTDKAVLRTGADLVLALSRKPGFEAIPVIVVTGTAPEARAVLRDVRKEAPVPIFEKPVAFDVLLEAVTQALHGPAALHERSETR